MKKSTEVLLDGLCKAGLEPAITRQCHDGKFSLIWHVDDDSDRYVEAADSLHSSDVVLIARDGYCKRLEAVVLSDFLEIEKWIASQLAVMSRIRSPRGPLIPKIIPGSKLSDGQITEELSHLEKAFAELRGEGGGSPGEWIVERMDELETEL